MFKEFNHRRIDLFPAGAGVILPCVKISPHDISIPRRRGGDPNENSIQCL